MTKTSPNQFIIKGKLYIFSDWQAPQQTIMTASSNVYPSPVLNAVVVQAGDVPTTDSDASTKPVSGFNPLLGSPAMPVNIKVLKPPETFCSRVLNYIQVIVTIVFLIFLMASLYAFMSGAGAQINVNNNSNAASLIVQRPMTKFADIQGCDEIKQQLEQIVDFLRNPVKYQRFGAEMPRGYLLQGPPGVGKTMLAKAVAGEANVPFLAMSGSEFDEMFVGVGAARVRNLFTTARAQSQAVIFIDEIDAIASKRTAMDRSLNRQTLNQLLVEMDGFRTKPGIIVLAATNSVDIIDPALLRPGRFDRTLTLHLPDIKGRTAILKSLMAKISPVILADDFNIESIARLTTGFSGAQLTQLINQAKLFAALDKSTSKINMDHLNRAIKYVALGPERSLAMKPEDRKVVAHHEAGHAIVALATDGAMPVESATIIPHGDALGAVLMRPEDDTFRMTRKQMLASIDVALAGYAAEELLGGGVNEVSTGPASDLHHANQIAKRIVHSGFGSQTRFLQPSADLASEAAKQGLERDVQDVLDDSRKRVAALLQREKEAWEAFAAALLEKESLIKEEIYELWAKYRVEKKENLLKFSAKKCRKSWLQN